MVLSWLRGLAGFLWGPGTLALLTGTGIFLLLRTRFLPWRNLGWALRTALSPEARRRREEGGVTPFASLMTTLAATMGAGNLAGVAAALAAGGPGALVWMDLVALLGLSTKLSECLLSVKFRCRDGQGTPYGGPMYVLRRGLGLPCLGAFYALAAVCSSLGMGGMAQANAVAGALGASFGVPVCVTAPVTAALALAVILGGMGRISKVSAAAVPVMAAVYLGASFAVLWICRENLPYAVMEIFRCAVSPRAAAGGAAGTLLNTVRQGVARGVFSNEAGMGSAGIAAAASMEESPARQGYIGMTGAFFDTCVVCTVTGLVLCCSGALEMAGEADGAALTVLAFQRALGDAGGYLVGVSAVLFAFTSILGGACQGERAFAYLTGGRGMGIYRVGFTAAVLWGAGAKLEAVLCFSDICNALMCLPNLVSLLVLAGVTARELEAFQVEVRRRGRR